MKKHYPNQKGNFPQDQGFQGFNRDPIPWVTDTIIVEGQPMTIIFPSGDEDIRKAES